MLKLTGTEVVAIFEDWHGNGGELSLHDLKLKYDMDLNSVYSVISAVMTPQALGTKKVTGLKVHAYDPAYGTRDKEKRK